MADTTDLMFSGVVTFGHLKAPFDFGDQMSEVKVMGHKGQFPIGASVNFILLLEWPNFNRTYICPRDTFPR